MSEVKAILYSIVRNNTFAYRVMECYKQLLINVDWHLTARTVAFIDLLTLSSIEIRLLMEVKNHVSNQTEDE